MKMMHASTIYTNRSLRLTVLSHRDEKEGASTPSSVYCDYTHLTRASTLEDEPQAVKAEAQPQNTAEQHSTARRSREPQPPARHSDNTPRTGCPARGSRSGGAPLSRRPAAPAPRTRVRERYAERARREWRPRATSHSRHSVASRLATPTTSSPTPALRQSPPPTPTHPSITIHNTTSTCARTHPAHTRATRRYVLSARWAHVVRARTTHGATDLVLSSPACACALLRPYRAAPSLRVRACSATRRRCVITATGPPPAGRPQEVLDSRSWSGSCPRPRPPVTAARPSRTR